MSDKLRQEPAFPQTETHHTGFDGQGNKEFTTITQGGISKRFYAACFAMQGLLSINATYNRQINKELLIKDAYLHADELLKQESN